MRTMFEMNGITPESLIEPIDFGVGEITLERLGMTPESSPFHQPPQEPEASNPDEDEPNFDEVESVPTQFSAESLSEEIISRTTQGFEGAIRYMMNNPKVMGLILSVGIGSYLWGKRK